MLEILSEKLSKIFRMLGNKGRLSEKDIDEALREVRLALLEADVNFKVVKEFLSKVRERAVNTQILESLTGVQQIIKIVNEELVNILGGGQSRLSTAAHPPSVVMLVGLQGSGKTTSCAKLALHLKRSGQRPLLVAADNHRPAAIEQLVTLGKQLEIPVFHEVVSVPSKDICAHGLAEARNMAASWVVVDTAGRLHIDEEMMAELAQVKQTLSPTEILLVVDAMTGQEAVRIAEEFHAKVSLTGLVLTKMDGDARGGAALSIRWVTGVPIKFIGIGEKVDAFEAFYPDRLASRILGMGDVLTLIEKVEASFDQKQVEQLKKKVQTATLDLNDFLDQLKAVRKMGPLGQVLDMIPGLGKIASKLPDGSEEKQLKKVEAIVLSMTPEERQNPAIIGGSRRRRIARGSGTTPQDINQLLNQFSQIQKLMKMGTKGKLPPSMLKAFQ